MNKEAELIRLCRDYSSLSDSDIQELLNAAQQVEENLGYQDIDVFIDIYSDVKKAALVVYHKPPKMKASLYQEVVVGRDALLENEPGVLRTLETGMNSVKLMALSQEAVLIQQSVYPIKNQEKTIGVTILEKDFAEEFVRVNNNIISDKMDQIQSSEALNHLDDIFVNQLHEAILIFDNYGYLVSSNLVAERLYRKIGYKDQILDMHYDNLTLDYTTFDYTMYQMTYENPNQPSEIETGYLNYYFIIKKIWIENGGKLVVIIQDCTDVKSKEAEIISKSVAIREIHHRVKNNLQSIVSLLRIQARRTKSEEAQKVLRESVSRIMAIASTHELLSKQVEDCVSLHQTLDAVTFNFRHLIQNSRDIELSLDIDRDIHVLSDEMVTISLIVNELLQNIFDHAFETNQQGKVQITGKKDRDLVSITVADNGVGFDPKANHGDSLGLMIINSYVKDKLKGKIKIESSKNQGTITCFTFRINNIDVV
ncbi:two-component sensor histidine kinase [Enterococcus sp. PF1-24]|uniref:sensor histidine kinase n=1 Tax=unclassified Enterococcus TaxID=2608891 RepID=UPI0024744768|nr:MULTISPECIES: sensor histidine kinase [unclassified Enterococcus]MDH6363331.1 two-component sensor histidine kinase [Enterococcus sp. PFB1-1]MDH6400368.1 two-component sensor histidine kinase [Enterococcus sp. PF1-24]